MLFVGIFTDKIYTHTTYLVPTMSPFLLPLLPSLPFPPVLVLPLSLLVFVLVSTPRVLILFLLAPSLLLQLLDVVTEDVLTQRTRVHSLVARIPVDLLLNLRVARVTVDFRSFAKKDEEIFAYLRNSTRIHRAKEKEWKRRVRKYQ